MRLIAIISIMVMPVATAAASLEQQYHDLIRLCATQTEPECAAAILEFSESQQAAQQATMVVHSSQPAMSMSSIDAAVAWLASQQNASGSWGAPWFGASKPTTEVRDTATVVEALTPAGGSQYAAGLVFLAAQSTESLDHLARITRVRGLDGQGVAVEATAILDARASGSGLPTSTPNYPNNGWGASTSTPYQGESNAFDTALALRALGPAPAVPSTNVAYLVACQNLDGGFGIQPGRESSLFLTLQSTLGLSEFPLEAGSATAISDGADYIVTFQDAQGLLAESGAMPTAYETALGALAFSAAGRTTEAALAASGLLSLQAPNGSWNDDPYTTGLAVIALPEPGQWMSLIAGGVLLACLNAYRHRL